MDSQEKTAAPNGTGRRAAGILNHRRPSDEVYHRHPGGKTIRLTDPDERQVLVEDVDGQVVLARQNVFEQRQGDEPDLIARYFQVKRKLVDR